MSEENQHWILSAAYRAAADEYPNVATMVWIVIGDVLNGFDKCGDVFPGVVDTERVACERSLDDLGNTMAVLIRRLGPRFAKQRARPELDRESFMADILEVIREAYDWCYRWKLPIRERAAAEMVHRVYRSYRRRFDSDRGPLPPAEVTMAATAALRHTEELRRHLSRLSSHPPVVIMPRDAEGTDHDDLRLLLKTILYELSPEEICTSSDEQERLREIGRFLRQMLIHIADAKERCLVLSNVAAAEQTLKTLIVLEEELGDALLTVCHRPVPKFAAHVDRVAGAKPLDRAMLLLQQARQKHCQSLRDAAVALEAEAMLLPHSTERRTESTRSPVRKSEEPTPGEVMPSDAIDQANPKNWVTARWIKTCTTLQRGAQAVREAISKGAAIRVRPRGNGPQKYFLPDIEHHFGRCVKSNP